MQLFRPFLVWIAFGLAPGLATADSAPVRVLPAGTPQHPTRLLVRFKPGIGAIERDIAHAQHGARVVKRFRTLPGLESIDVGGGASRAARIAEYAADPRVQYAEPVYELFASRVPNDPAYGSQWALENTGQNGGTPDVDLGAVPAWDMTVGSRDVAVGIIDSGIDYTHPDLAANVWANPGEVAGNGVDDDGDGYIDDVHGINAITGSGDPMDDEDHGSHVAGTIGAVGNNGIGVTGINWQVTLIACKFLSKTGSGYADDAIECMDYFAGLHDNHGVTVVATNNSWGGGGYSQAEADAIAALASRGILFIAAAGNESQNLDVTPSYPASYPNVLAVAATDSRDALASFSNYGASSVHIAAPGVDILSTISTFNKRNAGYPYASYNGTSMATPHVTGLVALLKAQDTSRTASQLRTLLFDGAVAVPGLASKTITGKRIRAWSADGFGALNCGRGEGEWLFDDGQRLKVNEELTLSLRYQIGCTSSPYVSVNAHVEPDDEVILMSDEGEAPDAKAGDGVYTAVWAAKTAGARTFTIAGAGSRTATWRSNGALPDSTDQVTDTTAKKKVPSRLTDDDSRGCGAAPAGAMLVWLLVPLLWKRNVR